MTYRIVLSLWSVQYSSEYVIVLVIRTSFLSQQCVQRHSQWRDLVCLHDVLFLFFWRKRVFLITSWCSVNLVRSWIPLESPLPTQSFPMTFSHTEWSIPVRALKSPGSACRVGTYAEIAIAWWLDFSFSVHSPPSSSRRSYINPMAIFCPFLSQMSFQYQRRDGSLGAQRYQYILAKITGNEGSSPFWYLTTFSVHQSTYIPCSKKTLLLSLFLERIKVNPVCAVSQSEI